MRLIFDQVEIEIKSNLGYLPPDSKWAIAPHTHTTYEVHFVTEGRGFNRSDTETLELHQNVVYVAPPGEVHSQWVDRAAPMSLYFLQFDIHTPNRNNLIQRIYAKIPFSLKELDIIYKTGNITTRSFGNKFRSQLKIAELIWRILEPVLCDSSVCQNNPLTSMNSCMEKALSYMQQQLLTPPSIEEVALACNVSPRHLSRIFSASIHMPIHSYLENERFLWAVSQLKETLLPIKEISSLMNFSSPQYFNQWFKRLSGQTPAEYRRFTHLQYTSNRQQQS